MGEWISDMDLTGSGIFLPLHVTCLLGISAIVKDLVQVGGMTTTRFRFRFRFKFQWQSGPMHCAFLYAPSMSLYPMRPAVGGICGMP